MSLDDITVNLNGEPHRLTRGDAWALLRQLHEMLWAGPLTRSKGEALCDACAEDERKAIVAFLRGPLSGPEAHDIADAIERGEHRAK